METQMKQDAFLSTFIFTDALVRYWH